MRNERVDRVWTDGQTNGQTNRWTDTYADKDCIQIGAMWLKTLYFLKMSLYFTKNSFKTFLLVQGFNQYPCWSLWNTYEKVVALQTFTEKIGQTGKFLKIWGWLFLFIYSGNWFIRVLKHSPWLKVSINIFGRDIGWEMRE